MNPLIAALLGLAAAAPFITAAWKTEPRRRPRSSFRSGNGRLVWTVVASMAAVGLSVAVSTIETDGLLGSLVVVVFAAAAVGIALCDAVTRRIPFWIAGVLVIVMAAVLGFDLMVGGEWSPVLYALLGGAIAFTAVGSVAFFSGGGLGGGDAVIAVVYALPLGMLEVRAVAWWLVLSLVLAAPVAVLRARQRGKGHRMPLGPFLMAAWVMVVALVL